MEFIFRDYIALLAAVLLVAAIVLLVVLLKNIFYKKSELEPEEIGEEPSTVEEKTAEISILEAHLESITKDVSEIKRKIDKLKVPAENESEIKTQLEKINLKLDAIYNVLSDFSKE